MTIDKSTLGPVELLVVAFPGSQLKGEIVPALKELVDAGTIRILDVVFVAKDADGTVGKLELSQLSDSESELYLELASSDDLEALVNDEDLDLAADLLEPGDSAALLVWEDVWAIRVTNAIRDAGGVLLALERVPAEAVDVVLDAIAAQ